MATGSLTKSQGRKSRDDRNGVEILLEFLGVNEALGFPVEAVVPIHVVHGDCDFGLVEIGEGELEGRGGDAGLFVEEVKGREKRREREARFWERTPQQQQKSGRLT